MNSRRIGTALLGAVGVGIAVVGSRYLADPVGQVPGYVGSTTLDPAVVAGNAKGVRDLAAGGAVTVLLAARQWRAAGWFAVGAATIPVGDMLVVLAQGGSVLTALAVHGATALVVLLAGVLLLRGSAPATVPARGRRAGRVVTSAVGRV
ncbi:uncharacterized protein DUF4267 [Actinomycetospora succinea]|uniref:Uncharacterized protein DUF4267 n=1 Tax=Actinomycetospora succinea TaxID=663603 RepID=A0A4R6UJA2_9PSEU|nr:DUF4267 domain-containing protein [Actinomycetospora succinea]TDQ46998.1 uncharacterized protein DUF4267 [Actinomycetospora succinea]